MINTKIFKMWFKYILLRRPINAEVIDEGIKYYNHTPRELKLLMRIKKLNTK